MFFDRFQALCEKKGVSVYRACMDAGLNRSAVAKWKAGGKPNGTSAGKLEAYLGVTTDYLLTGTPAEKERAELEGMLLGRIRAADQRLEQRRERPFSREELAVLFAAMLMEE